MGMGGEVYLDWWCRMEWNRLVHFLNMMFFHFTLFHPIQGIATHWLLSQPHSASTVYTHQLVGIRWCWLDFRYWWQAAQAFFLTRACIFLDNNLISWWSSKQPANQLWPDLMPRQSTGVLLSHCSKTSVDGLFYPSYSCLSLLLFFAIIEVLLWNLIYILS